MDDLKNILVFVVTIAFFIFSAIRKSKKKSPSKAGSIPQSIESLFGLQSESDGFNDVTKQYDIPVDSVENKKVEANDEEIIVDEGINAIPDEIKKTQITDIIIEKPVFDLKAAVLYSEILKRKEF